ncbi:MAG: GNAT family N-acetyltransferase [Alistipes sp.]|nr:GNAT family N-acetyltransferase [Alistipes sp.]
MTIKSLENCPFDTLFEAFSAAFSDYNRQWDAAQLRAMLARRGFDPALSFAAYDDTSRIAAFTLNGIGSFNGRRTAYDTGTGTRQAYRGRGLAAEIFRHALPRLARYGIRQYLLEVLQENKAAVSVYRGLGFEVSREFDYFVRPNSEITGCDLPRTSPFRLVPTAAAPDGELLPFGDFRPSWQNSAESILRAAKQIAGYDLRCGERTIGRIFFEPASGDIAWIAVDREFRRQGAATLLLQAAAGAIRSDSIRVVNTECSCDSIREFLKSNGFIHSGKQFEMILGI